MAPLPPPRDDGVHLYNVKRVSFFGRQDVPVICQNENGPCPLIGIANVLLLRGVLSLDAGGGADRVMVSTEELMSLLAARLLDVNQKPNAIAADQPDQCRGLEGFFDKRREIARIDGEVHR